MFERDYTRYLLVAWAAVAVGRIIFASSATPLSYGLLGVMWFLSAVLLVISIKELIAAETAERRIEATCLGLGMSALLAQGIFGGDDTIGITTPLFFGSLVLLVVVNARRRRRMGAA